ncbi:zinc metallopeptidase [bacterium]|nr:zinc metallopeptidase [bacterium]
MFYLVLFVGIAVVSYIVQANLRNKFEKYGRIPVANGMTGREVALKMLYDNGIYDVSVVSTGGSLTDHYNPATKTVNLSEEVYNECSIAAAAVAAHECGHAVQHARAYAPLRLRSNLVPVVSFASQWLTWVILIGILTIEAYPQIMLAGIVLFATTTLFSFVTLPVEIDASRRATQWLKQSGIVSLSTYPYAVDALKSAAYTYVVAALSSLATLVYYIMMYMGRRD